MWNSISFGGNSPGTTDKWWVFFAPETLSAAAIDRRLDALAARLPPRSLARRARNLSRTPPVRPCDLPPSAERLQALELAGCRILRALPYINAAVVTGAPASIKSAADLRGVLDVRPVGQLRRLGDVDYPNLIDADAPVAEDYGVGYGQAALVNVPQAHSAGFTGRGVIIGVQDTGFDNLEHNCFQRLNVIAAFDFINGDDNVDDEEGQMGSGAHGTRTLSVLAGLDSGRFIGIAPEADYVLTKTENTAWEREIEEDWWIAGLWFHDSIGTDVLSSSLSYRDWYDWEDMDGATSVLTRAADSAAAAGIIIVNSMGNTGYAEHPDNKMGVPSDGRFVFSVGGVRPDSSHWQGASIGPTFDGRIKPDGVAQATSVWTAANYSQDGYMPRTGTSFSCPTVAGVAALVIQANPRLNAAQVRDILRSTAGRADNPDTLDGWGILNAMAAVNMAREMSAPDHRDVALDAFIFDIYPNPTNGFTTIHYDPRRSLSVKMMNMVGREVAAEIFSFAQGRVTIDCRELPNGIYLLTSPNVVGVKPRALVILK